MKSVKERPSEGEDALEALVLECLDRWESQGESALDDLCREHPSFAGRLHSRIMTLRNAGLLPTSAPDEKREFPEKLGDFRLVASLGGGGMGIVYRAVQESLGREVALKLVRPEQLYFPGARERFRREVETIARLQHPGIVPIYTVGDERGLPYFAMELVEGVSLADVLAKLADQDPSQLDARALLDALPPPKDGEVEGEIFRGAWPDVVARIVREVAEALEHAHRRSVLHRDIKPSNVMITRGGRVMLLDFGLSSREGVDRLTKTGSQVGTLHYLAPEQIEGGARVIDRQSDVYSLGVTLYELLALEPPFRAPSATVLFQRILSGSYTPLRSQNAAVSADLATVCAAAMERDPARRYATAADFARDLTNVLEHRPIDARRSSALVRLVRWSQRNPARATAAALAIALVVGGPTVLYLQQRAANERIRAANEDLRVANERTVRANEGLRVAVDETRTQRDRARQSLDVAVESVDRMLGRVGHEDLEGIPQVELVRKRILEDALELNQRLAEFEGADDRSGVRVATSRTRLAGVLTRLDRNDDALRELDAGVAVLRAAVANDGETATAASTTAAGERAHASAALADALSVRARALREIARHEDARRDEFEAIERYESLPDDPAKRDLRALTLASLRAHAAGTCFHLGRTAEAIELQSRAVIDARELAVRAPKQENLTQLASTLCTLGYMRLHVREGDEAKAALREAVEVHEKLLADDPFAVSSRKSMLDALVNLTSIDLEANELGEAESFARRSLEIGGTLVRDFPSTPRYRAALNDCRANVVIALRLGGLPEKQAEAARVEQELLDSQSMLVAQSPDSLDYRETYAIVLANAANQYMLSDPERALELFQASVEQDRELLKRQPDGPVYRKNYANHCFGLAQTYVLLNRTRDALETTRTAVATQPDDWLTLRRAVSKQFQAIQIAPEDQSLTSEERAALEKTCLDDAFAFYARAVEAGFADLKDAEQDPMIEPLRANAGWPALLERVRQTAAESRKP